MIYQASIVTAKNTAASAPKHTVLAVTAGLVYRVEFHFPSGSAGLMGVAVFDGLFQVWPSTAGQVFVSDNETIAFDDLYLKEKAPFQFDIYTYNTDDTYDHVFDFRVGLVSNEVFMARFLPYKSYDYFVRLLEQMRTEKEIAAEAQKEELLETPFEWLLRQEGIA